jgi:hypothetical protein
MPRLTRALRVCAGGGGGLCCREGAGAQAVADSVVAFYVKHGDDLEYDDCDDLSGALAAAVVTPSGPDAGGGTVTACATTTCADSDPSCAGSAPSTAV